jgi:hypothetical protein
MDIKLGGEEARFEGKPDQWFDLHPLAPAVRMTARAGVTGCSADQQAKYGASKTNSHRPRRPSRIARASASASPTGFSLP